MMKILFIGNCQVTSLSDIISAAEPDYICESKEVWKLTQADCEAISTSDYDVVIAQPLYSERYGKLTRDILRASCKGNLLLFIHNLHFEGVLPDCTYVGPLGHRVRGPMGTYHSSIVLRSFLEGQPIKHCVTHIQSGTGINANEAWGKAIASLQKREQDITVPFVDDLIHHVKSRRCFHVFNHPNVFLLERYAEKILSILQQRPNRVLNTKQTDLLERVGTWPTYSWLAKSLDLPYGDDRFFIPSIKETALSLTEFVERSYETYAKTDKEKLII